MLLVGAKPPGNNEPWAIERYQFSGEKRPCIRPVRQNARAFFFAYSGVIRENVRPAKDAYGLLASLLDHLGKRGDIHIVVLFKLCPMQIF